MPTHSKHWPNRPWILALCLSLTGLALHFAIDDSVDINGNHLYSRFALGVFILVGGVSFAFTLEQLRWHWAALFAITWGAVLAGISYWSNHLGSGLFLQDFPFWSGLTAAAIAIPLFQTIRDQGRTSLVYTTLHAHAWSDVVCWFAAWAFVGASFLLAHLLATLFALIEIDFLKDLLRDEWFIYLYIGATFGAALGILKEHEKIVANLQNLVMTILSILAPVLCVGLGLFILSLPFTGLQPLWDATRGTTPTLLGCAIGALILANAIIRNETAEESPSRILRYSSAGLSLLLLPLAIIAFISMRQRLLQYGLTPDRIWGLIAVSVALAYGVAYLVSLLFYRRDWMAKIRASNTKLAVAMCLLMLFLALPILNFGAISAADQLARLEDGRTKTENFDFVAFAYDFGPHGRALLEELSLSTDNDLATAAKRALQSKNRWQAIEDSKAYKSNVLAKSKLVIFPQTVAIPDKLMQTINQQSACLGEYCLLLWDQGDNSARLLTANCSHMASTDRNSYQKCPPTLIQLEKHGDEWRSRQDEFGAGVKFIDSRKASDDERKAEKLAIKDAINRGDIEIRKVSRQQIFVGGRPVGQAFVDTHVDKPVEP